MEILKNEAFKTRFILLSLIGLAVLLLLGLGSKLILFSPKALAEDGFAVDSQPSTYPLTDSTTANIVVAGEDTYSLVDQSVNTNAAVVGGDTYPLNPTPTQVVVMPTSPPAEPAPRVVVVIPSTAPVQVNQNSTQTVNVGSQTATADANSGSSVDATQTKPSSVSVVVPSSAPQVVNVTPAQPPPTFIFKYPECDWNNHWVRDVWQNTATGEYQYRNLHFQDGACGFTATRPTPFSQLSPAPQVAVTAPAPVLPQSISVAQANVNVVPAGAAPVVLAQQPVAVTPTPACPYGVYTIVNGQRVCMYQTVTPTPPVVYPTTTPYVPPAIVITPSVCKPGLTPVTQPDGTIVCTSAPPTTSLPQTGLPIAASVLTGLVPLGWALRKFASEKVRKEEGASVIWQKRQFEKK